MCAACAKVIGPETSPQPDHPDAALCQFCWDDQQALQNLGPLLSPTARDLAALKSAISAANHPFTRS